MHTSKQICGSFEAEYFDYSKITKSDKENPVIKK